MVTDFDPDLPGIPAYAAELNQVWTNLIDNAVEAMNGGGTLTVRTGIGRQRDGRDRRHRRGVPGGHEARVFEPFFSTKAVGQGTGLGLDMARADRGEAATAATSRPFEARARRG